MRYSFTRDELGWLHLTVAKPTPSDKGLTPTEAENILKQLQEELFGRQYKIHFKLKMNVSPMGKMKLDAQAIDFIKKQEENYPCKKRGKHHQHNYEYYALTLHALRKLNYVGDDGELVDQTGLSEAIGLRRASLCTNYAKLKNVEVNETYLEIERNLFNRDL